MRGKALGMAAAAMLAAAGLYAGASERVWAIGSSGTHTVPPETFARPLSSFEMRKIETYLRQIFGNAELRLVAAPPEAEVWLGGHFMGIVFPDDQKDGRTFYFEMAIFEEELNTMPPAVRNR